VPCEPISIVDLGASVGYFTLRAIDRLRCAGVRDVRITAVEADEVCCRRFEQRMRENGLTSQVTLVRGAVGPRGGAGRLDVTDQLYAFRVVDPQAGGSGPLVQYVDLAAHLGDAGAIDLLKCDIEGSELLFLRSYPDLLRTVRAVVIEIHHQLCDGDECRRLLAEYGLARQTTLGAGPVASTILAHR